MEDKRKQNGGHSTKPIKPDDKRLLTKAEDLRLYDIGISAIESEYGSQQKYWNHIAKESKDSINHLKLLTEYIYGKPKQEINQLNYNVDEKDLNEAEIKRIRDVIESKF